MERCDFSSVMDVIREYINDTKCPSQMDIMYLLFNSFINDEKSKDFYFDNGLVCRWVNGTARISPKIIEYYSDTESENSLAYDIEASVFPVMTDYPMAVQKLYNLLVRDSTVSEQKKTELTASQSDMPLFTAKIISFSMARNFVKRDVNLISGEQSPIIKDYIFNTVPKPCHHFCGRIDELEQLHKILEAENKVFVCGIPGIGKSEFVKAYAKQYRKEYTNIIFIPYSGELKRDIARLDFADDYGDKRFEKHSRFLKTLKKDSLIIVDNYNVLPEDEEYLPDLLDYPCKIVFTTRNRFDNASMFELNELNNEDLLKLFSYFYKETEKHRATVEQIISLIHSHTFAVELAARLLDKSLLSPKALLKKLQKEKIVLQSDDEIRIKKDNLNSRDTYSNHIKTLLSLNKLNNKEKETMRLMCLVPKMGINARLFASLAGFENMNSVNYLIDIGYIKSEEYGCISVHPLISEVTVDEFKPSVKNAKALIQNINSICLMHGEHIDYSESVINIIGRIKEVTDKDDVKVYLRLLEDSFSFAVQYGYSDEAKEIVSELEAMLSDDKTGSFKDRILLYDCKAALAGNKEDALCLELKAADYIPDITADFALLASNVYANIGGLYRETSELDKAKNYMMMAVMLLREFNLFEYHDSVTQAMNYAALLSDMGQYDNAIRCLENAAETVAKIRTEECEDYALIQQTLGSISFSAGNKNNALLYYKKAFNIYKKIYDGDDNADCNNLSSMMKLLKN